MILPYFYQIDFAQFRSPTATSMFCGVDHFLKSLEMMIRSLLTQSSLGFNNEN